MHANSDICRILMVLLPCKNSVYKKKVYLLLWKLQKVDIYTNNTHGHGKQVNKLLILEAMIHINMITCNPNRVLLKHLKYEELPKKNNRNINPNFFLYFKENSFKYTLMERDNNYNHCPTIIPNSLKAAFLYNGIIMSLKKCTNDFECNWDFIVQHPTVKQNISWVLECSTVLTLHIRQIFKRCLLSCNVSFLHRPAHTNPRSTVIKVRLVRYSLNSKNCWSLFRCSVDIFTALKKANEH